MDVCTCKSNMAIPLTNLLHIEQLTTPHSLLPVQIHSVNELLPDGTAELCMFTKTPKNGKKNRKRHALPVY